MAFSFDLASGLILVFFALALVFAFLLSKEASQERYWLFLILGSLGMSAYIFFARFAQDLIPMEWRSTAFDMLLLVAAFSFAYAFFGLYSSMKKIRERVSKELE